MALISLLLKRPPKGTKIKDFIIDATLSENHTRTAQVTNNPVEKGADVTDHIQVSPIELTINVIVSESPLDVGSSVKGVGVATAGAIAGSAAQIAAGAVLGLLNAGNNRVVDAYDLFTRMIESRIPFTVVTGLKEYESMVITSLSIDRDNTTGRALNFTMNLKQIRLVESAVVVIPKTPPAVNAAKRSNVGQQAKKELTDQNKTILAAGFDGVRGLF